jgi:hypothetical protein
MGLRCRVPYNVAYVLSLSVVSFLYKLSLADQAQVTLQLRVILLAGPLLLRVGELSEKFSTEA